MKESTKITLKSVIQSTVVIYFVGVFISWELNPAEWSFLLRTLLIIVGLVLYVISAVVLTLDSDKKEKKNNGIPV